MNKVSNICNKGLIVLIVIALVAPSVAGAATEAQSEAEANAFCKRVEKLATKAVLNASEKEAKLKAKKDKVEERLALRQLSNENKILKQKSNNDFDETFKKVTTSDAVAAYKEALKNALEKRDNAINIALTKFKSDLLKVSADRKIAINNAFLSYVNGVKDIWDKAEHNCKAGVDDLTIQKETQTALKSLRTTYSVQQKMQDNFGAYIEPIVKARSESVNKAHADFKAELVKAKAVLKEKASIISVTF